MVEMARKLASQLPFGWVCFSNPRLKHRVQLTTESHLPFGWVCFSNRKLARKYRAEGGESQLPFGWVCFSNGKSFLPEALAGALGSQLPFGWVCFSNGQTRPRSLADLRVSIAFRLGLFL